MNVPQGDYAILKRSAAGTMGKTAFVLLRGTHRFGPGPALENSASGASTPPHISKDKGRRYLNAPGASERRGKFGRSRI